MALQLALAAPENVHPLALVEAALFVGPDEAACRAALRRTIEAFGENTVETVVDKFIDAR